MRFLVLNSDAERRDGLKALLRQIDRHARINDAPDGFHARRLLRTQRFDLVAINWLDVGRVSELQALCSACSPTPAAMLIDEATPQAIQRFFNYGVAGVIPHSTRPHLIVRALEMVLLGGHYIPPIALSLLPSTSTLAARRDAHFQTLAGSLPRRPTAGLLSPRQAQIMRFVHLGSTNKMIARTLGISEGTVKIHLASIFQQLGAANRAAAVAIYNGWLSPHLEVLLASRDRARKPALGERGPVPLRAQRNDRPYPLPGEHAGTHELPLAAEPPARFRRQR
ncbi:response regulator transcription factor [Burkholderia pseudomultivorans]|uniref:Helix-turn-helix transcriptional regulator n=1 Tax=Burkholderia pseudomultivorans TaxID=1207504 RepID=A0A132EJL9_9BURK|nr:response regulator transcription factor [Burkholderia pseudomultivorans]KWF31246.1 helix-turn-helix transcriptional regulator [Burkholderia pseudomultivorans]MDR8728680.1 Transcriptional regulatory protein DegU [Burkholderia pseudomultivorans]MDR8736824.1 Transcriptional regulatory protein DegU [Burkholderia pseudomultivorans]MDR8743274.1 Transcriptional regulatory protein DegU [Burkholderia pseudomultivorans]MDR8754971.1 Transcriptional regulatory protein DegU [Burkholderia pseudomultivora